MNLGRTLSEALHGTTAADIIEEAATRLNTTPENLWVHVLEAGVKILKQHVSSQLPEAAHRNPTAASEAVRASRATTQTEDNAGTPGEDTEVGEPPEIRHGVQLPLTATAQKARARNLRIVRN